MKRLRVSRSVKNLLNNNDNDNNSMMDKFLDSITFVKSDVTFRGYLFGIYQVYKFLFDKNNLSIMKNIWLIAF